MAFLKQKFRVDESQLMIIVDGDTGSPLKNDKGGDMGLMLTNLETEACKKIRAQFHNRHKKTQPSFAETEKFNVALLTAATVGFHQLQWDEGGDVVEHSEELAKEIYEQSDIVRKQVDKFLGNDEHFLAKVLAA